MKPQILHDKQLRASKKEQQDTGKFLQLGKSRHFKRENSLKTSILVSPRDVPEFPPDRSRIEQAR